MTSIKLMLTGAQAWASATGPLTSGMVGVPVTIEYDEAWDGLTKNLMCRCSPWGSTDGEYRAILNVGDTATVAHEVMLPDMYLYLGVEGYSDDGTLVMPTTWARCGKIEYGASTCEDPSTDPELSIWNQLQIEMEKTKEYVLTPEQAVSIQAYAQAATQAAQEAQQAAEEAKQAVESGLYYIPVVSQPTDTTLKFEFKPSLSGFPIPKPVLVELPVSGGDNGEDSKGLTTAQINALHGMFKVCLFDDSRDVAGAISAFEAAFGITDPGGEDTPEVTTYGITYELTNVTFSNTAASVADGESFSAELTVADPLKLTSISITMGGEDITDTVYGDGYISIPAVTGDVVITAVAAELEYLDTVNCGTVDVIWFYTDDGATSDGYVNYQPLTVSTDITESNADVVAIVTNSGDSDVTTTVNTGSVASTDTINNYNLNYATKGSSVTIRAGQSIEVPFTVHAGHRAGVCTSDQTVTAAITGKLDVHEADPLTVATKTVGSTTYFYAGETTESESLNYVWSGKMAVAQIAYDADTVLRITIRNGTDSDFKNISFRVGAVASPDFGSGNVFYAETQAETGIKAGLYMVFAYTVPAGYYAMAYSGNADAEIIIEEVG